MKWNGCLKKYLFAVGGFLALTMIAWMLRETLTLANFTMLYTLLVLIIAIRLGTYPAMSTALVSFLTINFFLTRPYYTFLVADSRDVIDLAVFIVVAVLAGQLGARARTQTEVANRRAREQAVLYKLTRSMNQATDVKEIHQALNQVLLEELAAHQVYLLPNNTGVSSQQDNTIHYLLLQSTDTVYGTVCVSFEDDISTQERQLLSTCVTQAAMALQRIELAERLRASQKYKEADRLKTAILRAVSHDLRTPITVIKSAANNLHTLTDKLTSDEKSEIALGIEHEADHLNKLVGNLLDLSRLQAGALTLNQELNSLEEVVGDVAARIWQITGQERIHIDFPAEMPLVSFDYGLILQALSNLIENALRYEPPNSAIQIIGVICNDDARVRIVNHGETIMADERDRIMEPFFHSENGGHSGLGLPIAKGIAEAHRGQLLLEDTPGGGATFILVLPLYTEGNNDDEIKNPGG